MHKARAVVMAGKLPSAVRSVGFGDCGRSVAACDAGKPAGAAGSATRSQVQREREKNALRGAPARRARLQRALPLAPALATCAAWRALAWPLLEPADAPGVLYCT